MFLSSLGLIDFLFVEGFIMFIDNALSCSSQFLCVVLQIIFKHDSSWYQGNY